MSGQDYVYIVWDNKYAPSEYTVARTFPTKYQAVWWVENQENPHRYWIERWRHGDTEGHKV